MAIGPAWRSGNSLVVTIPTPEQHFYKIKEGSLVKWSIDEVQSQSKPIDTDSKTKKVKALKKKSQQSSEEKENGRKQRTKRKI